MRTVTDRVSNPFGIRLPRLVESGPAAVHGYGDANADFHVVGDYPGVHGGTETGVPFTGTQGARRLQGVLHDVGLLAEPYSDEPQIRNLYLSYLHASVTPGGERPDEASYGRLEPFFDAELRAISAHVLLPVGDRAVRHVLRTHSARSPLSAREAHGTEIKGRGFLVVPVSEPAEWTDDDAATLRETLAALLDRDYRQVSDLGRFLPGRETYIVR